jgi:hypothetical protein
MFPDHLANELTSLTPWFILKYAAKITTLRICRVRFDDWLPETYIGTIYHKDVLEIQRLCPELKEMRFDVVYDQPSLQPSHFKTPTIHLPAFHASNTWDYYTLSFILKTQNFIPRSIAGTIAAC